MFQEHERPAGHDASSDTISKSGASVPFFHKAEPVAPKHRAVSSKHQSISSPGKQRRGIADPLEEVVCDKFWHLPTRREEIGPRSGAGMVMADCRGRVKGFGHSARVSCTIITEISQVEGGGSSACYSEGSQATQAVGKPVYFTQNSGSYL